MFSERHNFSLSGPSYLTTVDWTNEHDRRRVIASLVQGTYVLEKERQKKRKGMAKPWWESFQFELFCALIDDNDSSIFGAIYEFKPQLASNNHYGIQGTPRFVIAFRGTMLKCKTYKRDLKLDCNIFRNGLHETSRFKFGMQAVREKVAEAGASKIWLAGHSLGSAIAMLAGKNMAKTGVYLQAFLFNPPFTSPPIEWIKSEKLKRGIRAIKGAFIAGIAWIKDDDDDDDDDDDHCHQGQGSAASEDQLLAAWSPCLFVNQNDILCSDYIGYFENWKRMERRGAGDIAKLTARHSLRGVLLENRESEPLHFLLSANLTVSRNSPPNLMGAHELSEWWRPDLKLKPTMLYQFSSTSVLRISYTSLCCHCRHLMLGIKYAAFKSRR